MIVNYTWNQFLGVIEVSKGIVVWFSTKNPELALLKEKFTFIVGGESRFDWLQ